MKKMKARAETWINVANHRFRTCQKPMETNIDMGKKAMSQPVKEKVFGKKGRISPIKTKARKMPQSFRIWISIFI